MTIEHHITLWDGKSAAGIKAVFDAYHADADFSDKIVSLSFTPSCEIGATWLLKAWLEAGNRLTARQIAKIYPALNHLQHWQAKLHLLQSMSYMPISEADSIHVYHFLRLTLTDQNKFVRAWAYHGFYLLSSQHSKYLNETKQYFQMALRDEAPSVKARIRNISKTGF
ncbi:hypothetical protein MN202_12005 [Rheinheimera muenzenbergensis]|uniref:HEAT repeat domain-containing protein n=1 Tax=Rheinheimera muenzenbergensis TaxID=1193628 RepID=A0ABU8C7P3_9GAMM